MSDTFLGTSRLLRSLGLASARMVSMGAQSDVDRYRKAVQDLQAKSATESRKVATARTHASKAAQRAAKASSPSSAATELREAERKEREANDAEKRRSNLEKQLSDRQRSLFQAQAKLEKERTTEQKRASSGLRTVLDDLSGSSETRLHRASHRSTSRSTRDLRV